MIVKLLTERHLEFLSITGGCRGPSESTLVKMSNCWKSRALAHINNKMTHTLALCTVKEMIAFNNSVTYVTLRINNKHNFILMKGPYYS